MDYMKLFQLVSIFAIIANSVVSAQEADTLPRLVNDPAPTNFVEMWAGFDPRAEPLDVETLKEWEQDDVVFRIVRFRIGIFKGKKATLAAIYGFPKHVIGTGERLPGLVQIHGGGQYADYRACLTNAKRGYATVTIAWAGRINAPGYRVTPAEVKLFWDGKTDDPAYKLTTDWGAVDGYHAPGRNAGNAFPSAKPAAWTLDSVESPRNSGWFLCALAVRRALTFLEQQPEVDAEKLGVYGHSMGGKLTVMTAVDRRVKAATPSCGGISDRDNKSALFRSTLGDDVSLKEVSCPIMFLSPANDFHGRIGDLPEATQEIKSQQWRVTCSPHHNHQDTSEYEVATQLWFDQHLKNAFAFPKTPETSLQLSTKDGVPTFTVKPDRSKAVLSVDVFYTQHGKPDERPEDRENTMHRFWHHAVATELKGRWTASLPIASTAQPLWVYANVLYSLESPVVGAGYYYGTYTANSFNLSSTLRMVSPDALKAADVRATLRPSLLIESFEDGWEKEWFTYKPNEWARATHKVYDESYKPPERASLALEVLADESNALVILLDEMAAEVQLDGGDKWQKFVLNPNDFRNLEGEALSSFSSIMRLKLSPSERLKPKRGSSKEPRIVRAKWRGAKPQFRHLRWVVPATDNNSNQQ
jgi:hypothetical protein